METIGFWPEKGQRNYWQRTFFLLVPAAMLVYAALVEKDSNSVWTVFVISPWMLVFFSIFEAYDRGMPCEVQSLWWATWVTMVLELIILVALSSVSMALTGKDPFTFQWVRVAYAVIIYFFFVAFAWALYDNQSLKAQHCARE